MDRRAWRSFPHAVELVAVGVCRFRGRCDVGFTTRRDTPVELEVRTRRRSHARRLPNMYALL